MKKKNLHFMFFLFFLHTSSSLANIYNKCFITTYTSCSSILYLDGENFKCDIVKNKIRNFDEFKFNRYSNNNLLSSKKYKNGIIEDVKFELIKDNKIIVFYEIFTDEYAKDLKLKYDKYKIKLNPKERVKYFKINNYDDFELIQSHEITEHEANSILTNVKITKLEKNKKRLYVNEKKKEFEFYYDRLSANPIYKCTN